eukprot:scaffold11663_cov73-Phaeocystis_antarctica.AAC.1
MPWHGRETSERAYSGGTFATRTTVPAGDEAQLDRRAAQLERLQREAYASSRLHVPGPRLAGRHEAVEHVDAGKRHALVLLFGAVVAL